MANGMSTRWWPAARSGGRIGLVCALLAASVTSLAAQVSAPRQLTELKSGLHSVPAGQALLLTVVETGSTKAVSDVKIEFRDAADQQRGFVSRQLVRGKPVQLRVAAPTSSARQLRAIVQIIAGPGSEAIVGLESHNVDVVMVKALCSPPLFDPGPDGDVEEGNEGNCDGWRLNWFTLEPTPANSADVN